MLHFQSPGAILFQLGPLTIRWYGLFIALGFVAAVMVATRFARRWQLDQDKVINSSFVGFIGGIAGARLYYVALSWSQFARNPLEMFATWNGGLSIHGGIIFGMISGLTFARLSGLPVLRMMDMAGCAFPIAQCIGRWGNFFNSEAFGLPVDKSFPLALYIPEVSRPPKFATNEFFHPTFLYESVWNLAVFLFVYFFASKKLAGYPGVTFMVYLALYSIGRLLIEPIRTDSIMADTIPVPIIASAAMLILALIAIPALVFYHRKNTPSEG
ncbi:MAG: prolipoprotein diacylglyceryl transferase [Cyanobacteria bacterium HKST-UBA02]|nr:prolipoprotein diacylglyceryl transferase [Cyanobacteria bacterium HKST-UBA02]